MVCRASLVCVDLSVGYRNIELRRLLIDDDEKRAHNDYTKSRKSCSEHQPSIQPRSCAENDLEGMIEFVVARITRKSGEMIIET
jgi:hypothetical protein